MREMGGGVEVLEVGRKLVGVSRDLKSPENELVGLGMVVRGGGGGVGEFVDLLSKLDKSAALLCVGNNDGSGDAGVGNEGSGAAEDSDKLMCGVCQTPLDLRNVEPPTFTSLSTPCRHSYHKACILQHIGSDKLTCPGSTFKGGEGRGKGGGKCGVEFLKVVRDPRVVLRIAKGEEGALYYL